MGKIKIRRGDTARLKVVYTANGEPVDLTGTTVFFTVRANYANSETPSNDSDALIKEDVTVHSDPTAGETLVELSAEQTDVPAGKYKYDVQVVDGDEVTTIDIGDFQVLEHVTVRIA